MRLSLLLVFAVVTCASAQDATNNVPAAATPPPPIQPPKPPTNWVAVPAVTPDHPWVAPAVFPSFPAAMDLWPDGKMPGEATPDPEQERGIYKGQYWTLTNVSHPTMAIFLAPNATSPVPAAIICPGGGYGGLSYSLEGGDIATWLNKIGITGVVLKYRVPKNRDGALMDIQRAIRLVRSHAKEWNIDPDRIGVFGFSAGGHLAIRLGTNWERDSYPKVDDVDSVSSKPDFIVVNYPAYLGNRQGPDPQLPISASIPPLLMFQAEDDVNYIGGTKVYDAALTEAKVPHTFTIFPDGGHGYSVHTNKSAKAWTDQAVAWLKAQGVLR